MQKLCEKRCFAAIIGSNRGVFALFDVSSRFETQKQ